MIRSIFGMSKALQARVDALSSMVAATSPDPKVQAALQASVETAQQTAQTAQTAAATALQNTATLTQTVEALNKLSSDYVTAVAASREDRADLRARIIALEARKTTIALGRVATPALVLGAAQDVVVTLTRPMPSATYQIDVLPVAALLGRPAITIKAQTTTTVTLTIRAAVALTAGSVDLIAWTHG